MHIHQTFRRSFWNPLKHFYYLLMLTCVLWVWYMYESQNLHEFWNSCYVYKMRIKLCQISTKNKYYVRAHPASRSWNPTATATVIVTATPTETATQIEVFGILWSLTYSQKPFRYMWQKINKFMYENNA